MVRLLLLAALPLDRPDLALPPLPSCPQPVVARPPRLLAPFGVPLLLLQRADCAEAGDARGVALRGVALPPLLRRRDFPADVVARLAAVVARLYLGVSDEGVAECARERPDDCWRGVRAAAVRR